MLWNSPRFEQPLNPGLECKAFVTDVDPNITFLGLSMAARKTLIACFPTIRLYDTPSGQSDPDSEEAPGCAIRAVLQRRVFGGLPRRLQNGGACT